MVFPPLAEDDETGLIFFHGMHRFAAAECLPQVWQRYIINRAERKRKEVVMRHKCICFRDASGTQDIHAQLWLPDSAPRAIVQVVHGINEYGGRYASFAQYLAVFNIGLAVHDQIDRKSVV